MRRGIGEIRLGCRRHFRSLPAHFAAFVTVVAHPFLRSDAKPMGNEGAINDP
jgi:hypothetical protein